MRKNFIIPRALLSGFLAFAAFGLLGSKAIAQEAAPAASKEVIAEFEKALAAAKDGSSEARHRLAVKRVIRDAEESLASHANSPSRFLILEFIFRARQQLIALDGAADHRKARLETCRELV